MSLSPSVLKVLVAFAVGGMLGGTYIVFKSIILYAFLYSYHFLFCLFWICKNELINMNMYM